VNDHLTGSEVALELLTSALDGRAELAAIDLNKLEQRADDQRQKVEVKL
jgi:hypothetical protein